MADLNKKTYQMVSELYPVSNTIEPVEQWLGFEEAL